MILLERYFFFVFLNKYSPRYEYQEKISGKAPRKAKEKDETLYPKSVLQTISDSSGHKNSLPLFF